jgi:hypothetical protein
MPPRSTKKGDSGKKSGDYSGGQSKSSQQLPVIRITWNLVETVSNEYIYLSQCPESLKSEVKLPVEAENLADPYYLSAQGREGVDSTYFEV